MKAATTTPPSHLRLSKQNNKNNPMISQKSIIKSKKGLRESKHEGYIGIQLIFILWRDFEYVHEDSKRGLVIT